MQQSSFTQQNSFQDLEPKNIIVIGKTGQGKSYFLNLLLQETPNQGKFKVYHSIDSGTHTCQIEKNIEVKYGNREEDTILINLIDTPGLFDSNDQLGNQTSNRSIEHFRNIEKTVVSQPFQKKISRILLVIKADNKFDEHVKKMIEISNLLVGQFLKVCVILTKCQREYEEEEQSGEQILQILKQKEYEWRKKLASYGIENVFLIGNKNIMQQQSQYSQVNDFYTQQWLELYKNLQRAALGQIKTWNDLSWSDQITIAKYFGFTLNNNSGAGCLSLNCNIDGENGQKISVKEYQTKLIKAKISVKGYKQPNTLLGMIHYSEENKSDFLRIIYKHTNKEKYVELTENHLIYCYNRDKFIRANQLTLDDYLLFEGFSQVKIIKIEKVFQSGFYSPLTTTGNFFSNGIFLSCYVSPPEFPVSQGVHINKGQNKNQYYFLIFFSNK